MDQNSAPDKVISDAALTAAHEAASLRPLAIRVAELETQLAVERAEHASRLRQSDRAARSLRQALQTVRAELRHLKAERDDLLAARDECVRQLGVFREREQAMSVRDDIAALSDDGATAHIVASAISRAQSADVELARCRQVMAVLKARVRELEGGDGRSTVVEILEQLHAELSQRDAERVRAAEALGKLEQAVEDGEGRARRAETQLAVLREQLESEAAERVGRPTTPEAASVALRPRAPAGCEPATDSASLASTATSTLAGTPSESHRSGAAASDDVAARTEADATGRDAADAVDDSAAYHDSGDASGLLLESDSVAAIVSPTESRAAVAPAVLGLDSAHPPASPEPRSLDEEECAEDAGSASEALGHVGVELPGLRIEREVARAAAYAGWHARPHDGGRPVTVYVPHASTPEPDPAAVGVLVRMRHPNLVRFLSYAHGDGCRRLLYARPVGEGADAWVTRVGHISERLALAVAIQAARGLAAAAEHGIHHGDLSPGSLWVDPGGGVRVGGMGLRALIATDHPPEHVGYAAPEQRAPGAPSSRGDMYALGAVLYFLLTGCAAIAVRNSGSDAAGVPDPRRMREDVSEGAARLVAALTATDPRERPSSWQAVISDLEDVVAGRPLPPRPPHRPPGLLRRAIGRPHVVAGLLAIPLVLTAAILHVQAGFEPTPRESFDAVAVRAERLVRLGDVDGARRLYGRFVSDTGDPAVEADARARLDALPD